MIDALQRPIPVGGSDIPSDMASPGFNDELPLETPGGE